MHLICHHGSCHPFSVWSHAPYIPSAISNLYIRIQTHFRHSPFCGAKRHPRVWLRKAFFPWVVNQIRSEAKGLHSLPKIGRFPGYVWRIWSDMNQIASSLVAQFPFRTSRKTLTFSQVSPFLGLMLLIPLLSIRRKRAAVKSKRQYLLHVSVIFHHKNMMINQKYCLVMPIATSRHPQIIIGKEFHQSIPSP